LDPKLGMPRDWDLFSYAGVPLAVALFYTLLAGRTSITTRSAAVLSISLSLLVLIPRAGAQMSERIALAHLDDYRALDKIKNRNVRVMLGQYYQDRGREEAFQREAKRYERDFPEELTVTEALEQMYAGSYRQAAVLLAEVIEKNPLNWNAWSILGASYTRQKRLDSAMLCLKIADGLNPYNPIIYNNLGWAHFEKGEYEPAQEFWRRALKQDSLLVNALMGLDRTAWQLKNAERPCAHLSRGTTIGDPTVDLLRALGDCFLAYQDYDRARETYDEALRKGMDSTYFERLTKNFPQLSR
ncbi:MAG TPA: tetratricopeptide repeat protein, partial [Candidatus Deferrimicrobium sp.]|nr:tetratricopeptide repeat protein [Candidatus Deferrimicrobium sp.]